MMWLCLIFSEFRNHRCQGHWYVVGVLPPFPFSKTAIMYAFFQVLGISSESTDDWKMSYTVLLMLDWRHVFRNNVVLAI